MSEDPVLPQHLLETYLQNQTAADRCIRVFGNQRLLPFLKHLYRLQTPQPWFAFVDSSGARYFTHFVKLEKVVKNPRSITGSQKLIAAAKNEGMIF